jgi:hypothetical protein
MLSEMCNHILPPAWSECSHFLWLARLRALQPLRRACARTTTFLWLVLVLAAPRLRSDLAGVMSWVCSLDLSDASYYCLLHFSTPRPWTSTASLNSGNELSSIFSGAVCYGSRTVRSCWGMASNAPKKVVRCRASKVNTKRPAATPRPPSSWAILCRWWRCWCKRPAFAWLCR